MSASQFTTQTPIEPLNQSLSENTHIIVSPRYVLTILTVYGVSYIIIPMESSAYNIPESIMKLTYIVIIVILSYVTAVRSSIKPDYLTKNEKYKIICYMWILPVITTLIFYFKFKKLRPSVAKTTRTIGVKVFLVQIIMMAVLFFLLSYFMSHLSLHIAGGF